MTTISACRGCGVSELKEFLDLGETPVLIRGELGESLLECGLQCTFDPSFYGHHKEFDISTQSKGRAYDRGLGYVIDRGAQHEDHGG